MSEIQQIAREMAHWSALKTAAEFRYQQARTAYLEAANATGLDLRAVDVALGDLPMAAVTVSPVKEVGRIADMYVFAKWVAARHPEELIPAVRPSFIAAVEAMSDAEEDGVAVDKETGEIIPGVGKVKTGGELRVVCTTQFKMQVLAETVLPDGAFQ